MTAAAPHGSFTLVLAGVLMLAGGVVGSLMQTDFGSVAVEAVRFLAADGRVVEGRLHRPRAATALARAPAALLVHGVPAAADATSNLALELARRGYVVLAIDQPGYGGSRGPVGAGGYGAVDGLAFLHTLLFVDHDAVVLIGHGAGGAGVLIAAALEPDGHAAVVLLGAAPGALGAPDADDAFPRNLALVVPQFDEFARELWGVEVAHRVGASPRMRAAFGAVDRVQASAMSGSVEAGTARIWYAPTVINPAVAFTGVGIAAVLDWVQRTSPPPAPLAPNDQVWVLREAGSALVLLGFVLSLFAFSGMLLQTRAFAPLRHRLAPAAGLSGPAWWVGALLVAAVPAVSYLWARTRAEELVPVSPLLPQPETTALVGWLTFNGGVLLVIVLAWYLLAGRARGARADTLGLETVGGFRAPSFALLVVALSYGSLALIEAAFGVRARLWLLAPSPPSFDMTLTIVVYAVPSVLAFAFWAMAWHALLRPEGAAREGVDATVANALLAVGGLLVLVLVQYANALAGQPLPFGEPAATITALELIAPLAVAAMLSTYLFARTGTVWPGAWIAALSLTIYLVNLRATVAAL